jgi:excisionase family DNA binding protein
MFDTQNPAERLLKPAEVALILRVSRTQIYRLMHSELPCIRFGGGTVRIRAGDLEQYLVNHLETHNKNGDLHPK